MNNLGIKNTLKISKLRENYKNELNNFLNTLKADLGSEVQIDMANKLHSIGLIFFLEIENAVIKQRKQNGYCGPEIAEDCQSTLETILFHYNLLKQIEEKTNLPKGTFTPSSTAYSAMQAAVKHHHPELANDLIIKFKSAGLPIYGFTRKTPLRDRFHGLNPIFLILGIIFFIISLILAFIPATSMTVFMFRLSAAFSGGMLGGVFGGTLKIKGSIENWKIEATGALGLTVMIYLINPAQFILTI